MPAEKHVFIVTTVLHVRIVEEILRENAFPGTMVIAIGNREGNVRAAAERLFSSPSFSGIGLFFLGSQWFRLLFSMLMRLRISLFCLLGGHVFIYAGHLKTTPVRLIYGNGRGVVLRVFDDGVGNLVNGSFLVKKEPPLRRVFLFFLGVWVSIDEVLKAIDVHYTIYDFQNIYDEYAKEKIKISIFSNECNSEFEDLGDIHILLTQPYSEIGAYDLGYELSAYKKSVSALGVEYRIPHPAESLDKASIGIPVLRSTYSAEEFVVNLSRFLTVHIYSFGSSVLINLHGLPNVHCSWLTYGAMGRLNLKGGLPDGARFIDIDLEGKE